MIDEALALQTFSTKRRLSKFLSLQCKKALLEAGYWFHKVTSTFCSEALFERLHAHPIRATNQAASRTTGTTCSEVLGGEMARSAVPCALLSRSGPAFLAPAQCFNVASWSVQEEGSRRIHVASTRTHDFTCHPFQTSFQLWAISAELQSPFP